MASIKKLTIFIILIIATFSLAEGNDKPLEVVKKIADKIMEESDFEFDLIPQKTVIGVQVLNFGETLNADPGSAAYALGSIIIKSDSTVKLGINHNSGIKIWINDKKVFEKIKGGKIKFTEIAYGMFTYDDTISVKLQKGKNKILIKSLFAPNDWNVFISDIKDDPEERSTITFKNYFLNEELSSNWVFSGPFFQSDKINTALPPEVSIKKYYKYQEKMFSWQLPKKNILLELKIDSTNTFTKDSYLDWHYANGLTMMCLLSLSKQTDDPKYKNFVKKYTDFIIDNYDYFKNQYEQKHALRGSYHRIFRRTMLDDAGSACLPFLELYSSTFDEKYKIIIDSMDEFIVNDQVRLSDGTFCRPEPVKMTVWADDLFMSVPFFLRMAKIKNNEKYYNDAARQIINFHDLLYDKNKGLFKHGWFSQTQKTSAVFWGRANGWIMWAISEALIYLPKNNPEYKSILKIYREFVEGLIKYQDKDGMWHQVLDHPESYKETSCTAMFVLGISRGVLNNWLPENYKQYALKGWHALLGNINNGIVKNICVGTGIGKDINFYLNRPTRKNDPRGLGAVITAGIEISKLVNK